MPLELVHFLRIAISGLVFVAKLTILGVKDPTFALENSECLASSALKKEKKKKEEEELVVLSSLETFFQFVDLVAF